MPERTCIVCRRKDVKENLFRFVREVVDGDSSRILLDSENSLPGRGVYCHSSLACLNGKNLVTQLAATLLRGSSGGTRRGKRKKIEDKDTESINKVKKASIGEIIDEAITVAKKDSVKEQLKRIKSQLEGSPGTKVKGKKAKLRL